MENFIAVLDLGTYEIRGAVGQRKNDGTLKILAYDARKSEGILRGNILNPDFVARSIREVTLALEKKINRHIGKYYVNTGGLLIFEKENTAYRLLDEQMEVDAEVVKSIEQENFKISFDNGAQVMEVFPQSYSMDGEFEVHHQNPIGATGTKLEGHFLLSAVKKSGADVISRTLSKAGIPKHELILGAKALGESVLSDEEKEVGVVAIDIGAGKTSMIIYHKGVVKHAAVLPFGGAVVTRDLVSGCGIVQEKAEKMKLKFGAALADQQSENDFVSISGSEGWEPKEISCKTLAYIIQARMEEIFANVMHQIEKSGLYDVLGKGIVLTGGTSKLSDVVDLLKYKTGMDVRLGNGQRQIAENAEQFKDASLSVLAGMLKIGKMDCKQEKVEEPRPAPNKKSSRRRGREQDSPSLWDKFSDRLNGFFDEDDNAL